MHESCTDEGKVMSDHPAGTLWVTTGISSSFEVISSTGIVTSTCSGTIRRLGMRAMRTVVRKVSLSRLASNSVV